MDQERWQAIKAASTRLSEAKRRDEALKADELRVDWLFEDFHWPDSVKRMAIAELKGVLARYNDPELAAANAHWEAL